MKATVLSNGNLKMYSEYEQSKNTIDNSTYQTIEDLSMQLTSAFSEVFSMMLDKNKMWKGSDATMVTNIINALANAATDAMTSSYSKITGAYNMVYNSLKKDLDVYNEAIEKYNNDTNELARLKNQYIAYGQQMQALREKEDDISG